MNAKERFSDARLRKLEPQDKEYLITDLDCSILRVRVSPKGLKSFFVQFKYNGRQIKQKIGKVDEISIAKARELAKDIRSKVLAGEAIDKGANRGPNYDKEYTVKMLFDKYEKDHVQNLRDSTQETYRRYGDWIVSIYGEYPLDMDLTSAKAIIDRYSEGKKVTFNRFLATVRNAWNFALKEGMVQQNPFALVRKFKEVSRDERADGDQLQSIIDSIKQEENQISRSYHLTILFTMCRRGEADKMTWGDLDENIWTKPKGTTKNGKVQRVFLIPEVVEALKILPKKDDLVFQNFQGWTRAWKRILTRAGLPYPGVRVHDLRRSSAVWLLTTGRATVQEISFMLGHSSVAITQRVYAAYLGDNRKAAMAMGELFKK